MKSIAVALFHLLLVVSTASHGWLGHLGAGSKSYKGNEPVQQTPIAAPSVIRQIVNNLPVKDTNSPDLTYGRSALPALVATAAAGDTLLFNCRNIVLCMLV
ncbi:hypothetical protein K438DRAFT_1959122 [Mycena galopus ATCC 62051]|nr:hypothetical protein K438DRAFT_1959122 [Mycena galopus ATCC 62051]